MNGYTSDVIESLTKGESADLVRETVREGSRQASSREEAAACLMVSVIKAMAHSMGGVPTIVADIVARALTQDVDWEAVLDAVCVDHQLN